MGSRTPALLAASLMAGCSLVTSLDGLGPADGSANDVAIGDGGAGDVVTNDVVTNDAGDASAPPDAGGNLAQNPSFDDGQGGCGPAWGNGYGMTFTRVSPGRTGPYACEVCIGQGATGSFELSSLAPVSVQAGSYYAEAWLMTPDGGVPVGNGVGIQIVYDIDAGISGCQGIGNVCQGTFFQPPATWQKSTATFVSNGPGSVKITVHAYDNTAASCFLVDDVALYAQ